MTWLSVLFVGLSLISLIVWFYFQNRFKKTYLKNAVSPPGLPILGHALQIGDPTKILHILQKHKPYGKVFKLQIGPMKTMLFIANYKTIQFLLSSQKILEKAPIYRFLQSWLGQGLITSYGSNWKKYRRIITPSFHFQILEDFIHIFESCETKMIEKFKKYDGNQSLEIFSLVTLCTLDIICETAMGISVNAQDNETSEYVQSVKQLGHIFMERTFSIMQNYDFLYPLTRNYYVEKKALAILNNHTNSVIETRRQQLQNTKNKSNKQTKDDIGIKKRKALLDMLLETTVDGRPLTQEEIREQVTTFMLAGHDTTASAISFILYNIANHPQVQKQAYKEQCSIFGNCKNPQVSSSHFQQMKYLENIIKESLRLYPSVPLYARQVREKVEFDGGVFPPHAFLIINAFSIHRDPQYFKDPETFNPNRFDDIDGKQPFAYIPFSAGPRNCIGQKFAMFEMKSVVSKVLRNFELFPAFPKHIPILASELVLKSVNGIRIGIKSRN